MSIQAVLAPLFVLVALTFVLLFWAGGMRVNALRSGEMSRTDAGPREPAWRPHVLRVTDAWRNQLELPVLFYVLTILALMARKADLLFVLLAWVFVALQLMQAYVHVTGNHLAGRESLFIAGAIVLAVMWAFFMLRVLFG